MSSSTIGGSPRRVLDDAAGIAIRRLEDRLRTLEAELKNLRSPTGGVAVSYGSPSAEAIGSTASDGVATSVARSDHVHAMPAFGSVVAESVGGSNVDGAAASVAHSDHVHALPAFGTASGTFCQGNDSRLSNSRAPTGAAGGDLGGTYPNPKVAALTETSGPTSLVAGTITDGQFLKRSGSSLISGSPGVGGVNIWFPDAPPSSPSSKDDEFTAGSLDAKWLSFDPASILTKGVDTTKRMCKLSCTGNGTIRFCGIYQTTPASEFAVYAKVAYNYPASSNGATVGLFVSEDLSSSPGTKRFSTMERIVTTTSLLTRSRDWSAYNGSAANANTHNSESAYMRIRMNGATYFADFSPDGVSWVQQATRTLAYTPTDFGLIIEAGDNGVQFIGYIDFFRVFTGAGSSGIDATQIGQYV